MAARIGYSDKFDLSDALTFSGRPHVPVDYIETHFTQDENGQVTFLLKNESDGFGSRAAGDPVRRKLLNLLHMEGVNRIIIDLAEVVLLSSSYADEVFGKLFVEMGPMEFMRRVEVKNIDTLVRDLGPVDKSGSQITA